MDQLSVRACRLYCWQAGTQQCIVNTSSRFHCNNSFFTILLLQIVIFSIFTNPCYIWHKAPQCICLEWMVWQATYFILEPGTGSTVLLFCDRHPAGHRHYTLQGVIYIFQLRWNTILFQGKYHVTNMAVTTSIAGQSIALKMLSPKLWLSQHVCCVSQCCLYGSSLYKALWQINKSTSTEKESLSLCIDIIEYRQLINS